jgi:DNA helicase-2/ATP-dependent DNA helicase PcrA
VDFCITVNTIEDMKKQGMSYGDFAVLYRTNIQSRPIIDEFIRRNIPFKVKDSINNFFNHWICRDITSYLRLAADSGNASHLARIINRPVRYVTKESMEKAALNLSSGKSDIVRAFQDAGLKDFQLVKIADLNNNLKSLKYMAPSAAVAFIRRSIGYNDYIRNYSMESNIDVSELYDILDEYEMSSSGFKTIFEFLSHINEVSEKLESGSPSVPNKSDSVTLTTIHSAKGLEFPCIFISGAVEGLLPHRKSIKTGENIEEERRLFYVAITRAREGLFISAPKRHHGKSADCSRFFNEASGNAKEQPDSKQNTKLFSIGELVCHKIFGTGKIIGLNRGLIEIQFNNKTGRKQLDLDTCVENRLLEK